MHIGFVPITRSNLIIVVLSILLIAAVIGLAVLYPRATRTFVQAHQQHLVARAEKMAATFFRHSVEDQRRITFPIVMELKDRTCVELRSAAADGAGSYLACFSKTGARVDERATIGF